MDADWKEQARVKGQVVTQHPDTGMWAFGAHMGLYFFESPFFFLRHTVLHKWLGNYWVRRSFMKNGRGKHLMLSIVDFFTELQPLFSSLSM